MSAANKDDTTARAVASAPNAPLPSIEIRFTGVYAWMAVGFGVLCFALGLFLALIHHHRDLRFGLAVCLISLAAAIGGNYWRKHLHVVAQLTPRQLILRRDGALNWNDIASIDNKQIHASYRGAHGQSEWVCIKLKNKPVASTGVQSFFLKAKRAITGYDIIVPANEMSCTADWFITECRKRIAAAA